ncbi:MAG: alpha-E domain-containing protein [Candidatus Nanopelagicales bacterium]
MLSRIAESYFWMGRYLERAEATARMLSEHHQLLVEERLESEETACVVLLDALSLPRVDAVETAGLVRALVGTPDLPATISGSVSGARENARAIRDTISSDVYEALNGAYLALSRGLALAASPGVALHRVIERLLVVNGVLQWTMPRDEGYLFMDLGRSLERIDMTVRLMNVRHDQLWPETGPVATLRAAGMHDAFLRAGLSMSGDEVRAFLLLDEVNPRSVRSCAAHAEDAVRALQLMGVDDGGMLLREVGMLRSRVEYVVSPTPAEVDRLARDAQAGATRASDAVVEAYFRQAGTIVWSH